MGYSKQWDCDDFAAMFRIKAVEAHFRSGRNPDEGLAVGEVWYTREDGRGHAINLAVVEGGDLCFVEPQTGAELKLTASELQSFCFARF